MSILKKIDNVIIDGPVGVQALVNVAEWFTGCKFYSVARFAIVVSVAYSLTIDYQLFVAMYSEGIESVIFSLGFITAPVIVIGVFIFASIAQSETKKGFRNQMRDSNMGLFMRTLFLTVVIMRVYLAYSEPVLYFHKLPFNFGVALTYYILACSEAPPKRSTAPSWT